MSTKPHTSDHGPVQTGSSMLPRFAVMMFLQFFVWGSWYVSQTGFLGAQGMSGLTAAAYTVGPIAALISPVFLGLIADRFLPSQIVLGILHILGGLFMLAVPSSARPYDPAIDGSAFFQPYTLLLLGHMLCYMPTLALTASMPMSHMTSAQNQFPLIRVLGTIGWIVGNIVVAGSLAPWGLGGTEWLKNGDQQAFQFYLTGGAGIVLGLYAFSLPNTPPRAKGKAFSLREALGLDSLRLLRQPAYAVFIVCSFLICIPLAAYYNEGRNFVAYAGFSAPTGTMSFGQMAEIVFMLLMPLFFARLGVKYMLAVGMLAWVARYALFSLGADDRVAWMVIGGILLHGICYDFFFVTGMIYSEKKADADIKAQAQGFLVLVTQGLGLGVGAQLVGQLRGWNTTTVPATATEAATTSLNWEMFWFICAAMAAVVMLVFLVLFKDRDRDAGR